ncbi:MAG TPA: T9SS type A sorting domain-containing protein, partial [Cytophagaceae bacterium]
FWNPISQITDPTNYLVVVFIQDENTKEIYQAAYADIDPAILSQLPPPAAPLDGGRAGEAIINTLSLYPNPTNGNIYLEFDDVLPAGYTWQILDMYGRKIDAGVFATSADTYILSTEGYQEGMYTLQIGNRDSVLLTKKVSVIK